MPNHDDDFLEFGTAPVEPEGVAVVPQLDMPLASPPPAEPMRRAFSSAMPLRAFVAHNQRLLGISGFQFYAESRRMTPRPAEDWHQLYQEFMQRVIKR